MRKAFVALIILMMLVIVQVNTATTATLNGNQMVSLISTSGSINLSDLNGKSGQVNSSLTLQK